MKLATLLAALTALRCGWTWHSRGYTMEPDFSLYTQGGLGLFPSPLGRALGALGATPFAYVSCVAAGACVLLVALVARRAGGSPGLVALVATVMPASLYLGYAGIDSIGLAVLLAAIHWRSSLLGVTAALLHLNLAPFALLLLPRASWPARFVLATFAGLLTICLLLTPYSGIVYGLLDDGALPAAALGFAAFLVLAAPALLVSPLSRLAVLAIIIGVGECALQHHLQARYLLPATFLLASGARRPDLSRSVRWVRSRSWYPRERIDGLLTTGYAVKLVRDRERRDARASGENPGPPLTPVLRKGSSSSFARKAVSQLRASPFGGERP